MNQRASILYISDKNLGYVSSNYIIFHAGKKNPIVGPRVTVESVTVINLFYLDNHTRQHHAYRVL